MSNFSDRHTPASSPDQYPVLTSSELSRLLLDQEMNFAVATAFSSSPLSTTLLRHYLILSQNLEWICQDLLRHQQERESIFDVLSHSAPFQDIITPIVLNFWYRQCQVSPVNPPSPALRIVSDSSISEQEPEQRTVIIQEWSDSDSPSFVLYNCTWTVGYSSPSYRRRLSTRSFTFPTPNSCLFPSSYTFSTRYCSMFSLQMTWTFIDPMCLGWTRNLFILQKGWTHHTFLFSLSSRLPMFQPASALLSNMQPVGPYSCYLRHPFVVSLNNLQVWDSWTLLGG